MQSGYTLVSLHDPQINFVSKKSIIFLKDFKASFLTCCLVTLSFSCLSFGNSLATSLEVGGVPGKSFSTSSFAVSKMMITRNYIYIITVML